MLERSIFLKIYAVDKHLPDAYLDFPAEQERWTIAVVTQVHARSCLRPGQAVDDKKVRRLQRINTRDASGSTGNLLQVRSDIFIGCVVCSQLRVGFDTPVFAGVSINLWPPIAMFR